MKKLYLALIALIGLCGAVAFGNYNMTQGSGTAFGSVVVSSVHYAQQFICDLTTPAQCAAVSASGAVKTDSSATTQPVSGSVTANAGTNLNTSALSTSANQTNGNQLVKPSFNVAQLSSAVVSTAASGNSTLITRSVGTIKVYGIFFSCASSVVATLQNGTSTGVTGAMTLTTFFLPLQSEPYFTTTSTNNFVLNLGSAVQCSGSVYYLDT